MSQLKRLLFYRRSALHLQLGLHLDPAAGHQAGPRPRYCHRKAESWPPTGTSLPPVNGKRGG